MTDQKKRISELPECQSTEGLYTIGVNAQNESVKVPLGQILAQYDGVAQTATAAAQAAAAAAQAAQNAQNTANTARSEAAAAQRTANSAQSAAESAADAASAAARAAQAAQDTADDAMIVKGDVPTASKTKGGSNTASGNYSNALGQSNEVTGANGSAIGKSNVVSGNGGVALGENNTASGTDALAEGKGNLADGRYSHAEGIGTKAMSDSAHAQGSYNVGHNDTIDEVGIGTADNNRVNAEETKKTGAKFIKGIGGYDGTNPNQALSLQQVLASLDAKLFVNATKLLNLSEATTLACRLLRLVKMRLCIVSLALS